MIRAMTLTPNDRGDFKVNLYVDKFPSVHREPIYHKDDATFWYGEDEDGFVSFGVSYDRPTLGHKPGYMWSSRASVFNGYFDKMYIECTIYEFDKPNSLGCWGYFSIPTLIDNLTDNYEVATYHNKNDHETTYRVYRYGEVKDITSDGKCIETFVGNIPIKPDWEDVFELEPYICSEEV